jgi:hypothetical protein
LAGKTVASTEAEGLNPAHIGSNFEDFLKEEGLWSEEVEAYDGYCNTDLD